MRELCARLRAAWRLLRYGAPTAPPRDTMEVPVSELMDLVQNGFAALGLPFTWPYQATSDELRTLATSVEFMALVREDEWKRLVVDAPAWAAEAQGSGR